MASGDNVTIKVKGENADLLRALKQGEGRVKKFAQSAKGSFGALGAVVAAASVGLLTRKIFQLAKAWSAAAAVQEKAEKKLESVIRATGGAAGFTADQMKTYAQSLQDTTTFGDEVVINAQAILATFRNIKGENFTAATDAMLDMATVLDGDLKGAALQVGKALNDPIKGISALSRAGVTFSDEQKAMIKALQDTGDIAAAQTIILAEFNNQFGGAAQDEIETTAGKLAQFSNFAGDAGERIGQGLNVALADSIPLMQEWVTSMEQILQGEGQVGGALSSIGSGLGSLLNTLVKINGQGIVDVFAEDAENRKGMDTIRKFQNDQTRTRKKAALDKKKESAEIKARAAIAKKAAEDEDAADKKASDFVEARQREMQQKRVKDSEDFKKKRKQIADDVGKMIDDELAAQANAAAKVTAGEEKIEAKRRKARAAADAERHKASFVGLTDLNRRIQQSAASDNGPMGGARIQAANNRPMNQRGAFRGGGFGAADPFDMNDLPATVLNPQIDMGDKFVGVLEKTASEQSRREKVTHDQNSKRNKLLTDLLAKANNFGALK